MTESKHHWEARWSGSMPCLCHGEWTLLRDGESVDTEIPFQGSCAETFGTYSVWSFGGESGWLEEWDSYEDGMGCDEWCDEYGDWLATVAPKGEWKDIFEAFQAEDWRHNSCGGCI